MLFNAPEFLLFFLPVTFVGFAILARTGRPRWVALWVSAASLLFYGWWNPVHLPLFAASMVVNYALGRRLARAPSRALLAMGVAANIALLGYFKYTGFVVASLDQAFGLAWPVPAIVLPLAISFFTFQQIAYLSDAHDGAAVEHDFLRYCLFITFFPHLIAGPITHHREMLPQFDDPAAFRPRLDGVATGLTLFLLGLFKKVVLADPLAEPVRMVFSGAAEGAAWTFVDAWGGALAYALQIYFDFSGYTDMAIGLGLMFGISLPPNFDSPYKARTIIAFWSRWHMTLTRFLTAYIYNPLVLRATRRRVRRGLPLPRRGATTLGAFAGLVAGPTLLTMAVSGLWHGAGWQFVVFGLLHGVYLTVAHGWQAVKLRLGWRGEGNAAAAAAGVLLTFACVVVALVFFRADSVGTALHLLSGMAGGNGIVLHPRLLDLPGLGALAAGLAWPVADTVAFTPQRLAVVALLLALVWSAPNSQQWMRGWRTALAATPSASWVERLVPASAWRPTLAFGLAVGGIGVFALIRALSRAPTEFLYFQF